MKSSIALLKSNGSIESILCHESQHTELRLALYHSKKENIEKILSLGNILILEKLIEPPLGVKHDISHSAPGVCIFMSREGGAHRERKSTTYNSLYEYFNNTKQEKNYLLKDEIWYILDLKNKTLKNLEEILYKKEPRDDYQSYLLEEFKSQYDKKMMAENLNSILEKKPMARSKKI